MKSTVCTLFEGNYHLGVGALSNSLYAAGFRGVIWVGYRGGLPPWASTSKTISDYQEIEIALGCVIRFVPLETSLHFAHYKPTFMLAVIEHYSPQSEAVFYFDPDITITGRWACFEEWSQRGIAVCEDNVYFRFPCNHPTRLAWLDYLREQGYECQHTLDSYYNSGFIGLHKDHLGVLRIWRDLINGLGKRDTDLSKIKTGDRGHPFNVPDQDTLNIALMATNCPLSTIGPEGMGFIPGGYTMAHAVDSPKPWRKNFTISALKGFAPSQADKAFLRHLRGPINLYPSLIRTMMHLDAHCGAALGRFIRKN